MLTVGITGGIGSGKSIVSKVIAAMQFPVFNSDAISKEIVQNNDEVRQALIHLFGPSVYPKGILDRVFLAEIIFNDEHARNQINAIVHPKVREAFDQFAAKQNVEIVFNEAAILFETGSYKQFDRIILVTSPEEIRISRVAKRDNVDREIVRDRIRAQWSDEQKKPLANFIIVNDDKQPVLVQIEKTISELLR